MSATKIKSRNQPRPWSDELLPAIVRQSVASETATLLFDDSAILPETLRLVCNQIKSLRRRRSAITAVRFRCIRNDLVGEEFEQLFRQLFRNLKDLKSIAVSDASPSDPAPFQRYKALFKSLSALSGERETPRAQNIEQLSLSSLDLSGVEAGQILYQAGNGRQNLLEIEQCTTDAAFFQQLGSSEGSSVAGANLWSPSRLNLSWIEWTGNNILTLAQNGLAENSLTDLQLGCFDAASDSLYGVTLVMQRQMASLCVLTLGSQLDLFPSPESDAHSRAFLDCLGAENSSIHTLFLAASTFRAAFLDHLFAMLEQNTRLRKLGLNANSGRRTVELGGWQKKSLPRLSHLRSLTMRRVAVRSDKEFEQHFEPFVRLNTCLTEIQMDFVRNTATDELEARNSMVTIALRNKGIKHARSLITMDNVRNVVRNNNNNNKGDDNSGQHVDGCENVPLGLWSHALACFLRCWFWPKDESQPNHSAAYLSVCHCAAQASSRCHGGVRSKLTGKRRAAAAVDSV